MIAVTQLAIVVICAALVTLAIVGWLVISILKKAPKKQIVLTLISIPIVALVILVVGAIMVANSPAISTEQEYYTARTIRYAFVEACGDATSRVYEEWPHQEELHFDSSGNVVSWTRGEATCDLTERTWRCTCPSF
jgi:MFS-type transporter involved in bile tolerance (Atg22 family)